MEFSNFQISRPEFKELRRPTFSQHVYVDVVLLDGSPLSSQRDVFQLNTEFLSHIDHLDRLKQEIAHLHRDSFTFLGEAIEINADKKTIFLGDGNLVTYKYLIMVASSCREGDFNAFLQTLKNVMLLEALNARAKIMGSKTGTLEKTSNPNYSIPSAASSSNKLLPSLAQKRIAEGGVHRSHRSQSVFPKRLCQVKS